MGHVTWVMTGLVTNVTPSTGPQVHLTNSFIQSAYSLSETIILEHFTLLTFVMICLPRNLLAATFAMMMTWAAAPWL